MTDFCDGRLNLETALQRFYSPNRSRTAKAPSGRQNRVAMGGATEESGTRGSQTAAKCPRRICPQQMR